LPYPEEAEIKVSLPAKLSLKRFSKADRETNPWRGFGIYSLDVIREEAIVPDILKITPKRNRQHFTQGELPHHNLRTILQRLCQMHGLDFLTPRQICNRACEFEDAMISARGELQLTHRRAHQALTFIL
jgi:hypothetical protein